MAGSVVMIDWNRLEVRQFPSNEFSSLPRAGPAARLPAMHEKALCYLSAADPTLGELISRVGACRLRADRRTSPFESLVEAVAHQQLTGKAAKTILGRVKALHPTTPFPLRR